MDWLIAFIRNLFNAAPVPGFIPDEVDERDAWSDQVFGVATANDYPESVDWRPHFQNLKKQGSWPFCVSYAVAHLQEFNQAKEGINVRLSPRFLAVRSGTNRVGNSIRTVLEVARKEGIATEQDCPFNSDISTAYWSRIFNLGDVPAAAYIAAKQNAIEGYSRIGQWDIHGIKRAAAKGPIILAYGIGPGYSNGGVVSNPRYISAYHCTLLLGYDNRGNFFIGDSLVPQHKILSGAYSIPWIYEAVDLPTGWKESQVEMLYQSFDRLLKDRFGQPRNILAEQDQAQLLKRLIQPYVKKNPAFAGVAGKYWIIGIACFYGGWSLQDFIDDCSYYLVHGKHLYDFNQPKSEDALDKGTPTL